jgi:hypothetical protein
MLKFKRILASGLACIAFTSAGLAHATPEWVFQFTQTNLLPGDAVVTATGTLTISDAAFHSGLSIDRVYDPSAIIFGGSVGPANLIGTGIDALNFSASVAGLGVGAGLSDFVAAPPCGGGVCFPAWEVQLSSASDGTPTGTIAYFDSPGTDEFIFHLQGKMSGGTLNSDALNSSANCPRAGTCDFSGSFGLVSPVPEPSQLSIFAFGLLGLALVFGMRRQS